MCKYICLLFLSLHFDQFIYLLLNEHNRKVMLDIIIKYEIHWHVFPCFSLSSSSFVLHIICSSPQINMSIRRDCIDFGRFLENEKYVLKFLTVCLFVCNFGILFVLVVVECHLFENFYK